MVGGQEKSQRAERQTDLLITHRRPTSPQILGLLLHGLHAGIHIFQKTAQVANVSRQAWTLVANNDGYRLDGYVERKIYKALHLAECQGALADEAFVVEGNGIVVRENLVRCLRSLSISLPRPL